MMMVVITYWWSRKHPWNAMCTHARKVKGLPRGTGTLPPAELVIPKAHVKKHNTFIAPLTNSP
jgi:hypothetical protein